MTQQSTMTEPRSLRMNVWYDHESKQFKATSPDLNGWKSQGSTPHALHQQLKRTVRNRCIRLEVAFQNA